MASRFSPTVLPDPGPGFNAEAIAGALEQYQRQRQLQEDRRRAEEDRQREIEAFEEDRDYLRGQRRRETDRQEIEDYDAGIRDPNESLLNQISPEPQVVGGGPPQAPMVGIQGGSTPLARRIQEHAVAMQNPMMAAQPTRTRLPGQLDSSRQSFRELAAETANYQALPSGRYRDLRETPEQVELRRQQQEGEEAARVAAGLGADEATQQLIRANPEMLEDYIDHRFTMQRDQAQGTLQLKRDALNNKASLERARISAASRGGGGAGGAGGLSPTSAYSQARLLLSDMEGLSTAERVELVNQVAQALMAGGDPRYVIEMWEQNNFPVDASPNASGELALPPTRATPPQRGARGSLREGLARETDAISATPVPPTNVAELWDDIVANAQYLTDDELRAAGLAETEIREIRSGVY